MRLPSVPRPLRLRLALAAGLLGVLPAGGTPTGARDPAPGPAPTQEPAPALLPWPDQWTRQHGVRVELVDGGTIAYDAPVLLPVAELLAQELRTLTGLRLHPQPGEGTRGQLVLRSGWGLPEEGYELSVTGAAVIGCHGAEGALRGVATLLEALQEGGGRWWLSGLQVQDRTPSPWRGVTLEATGDLPVEVLEEVLELCWLLKVRQVHLELASDAGLGFASSTFPAAVRGGALSRADLAHLDAFAARRGVVLVPGIDLPAHLGALVATDPEGLGLAGARPGAASGGWIDPGSRPALERLDALLAELVELFPRSPWVHLGGSAARLEGLLEDPSVQALQARHGLRDARAVVQHVLVGRCEALAELEREAVLWDDLLFDVQPRVPPGTWVLARGEGALAPAELVARGLRVVNASRRPLELVGGGDWSPTRAPRRWSDAELEAWHPRRWERLRLDGGDADLRTVPPDAPVAGAHLMVRDCAPEALLDALWSALPVVAEQAWNPEARRPAEGLRERREAVAGRLLELLRPARFEVEGGRRDRAGVLRFSGALDVRAAASRPGTLRHTRDGRVPGPDSPVWPRELELREATELCVALFDDEGRRLGHPDRLRVAPEEVARVEVLEYAAPRTGWTRLPDFRALPRADERRAPRLGGGDRAGPVGLVQRARLDLPAGGTWTFDLRTARARATLVLDGEVVLERGPLPAWETSTVALELESGEHALELRYAQGWGGNLCAVEARPPGEVLARPAETWLVPLEGR